MIDTLVAARRLGAFTVTERFHDIGTPESLADTEAWLAGSDRATP